MTVTIETIVVPHTVQIIYDGALCSSHCQYQKRADLSPMMMSLPSCSLFDENLHRDSTKGVYLRCDQCLDASASKTKRAVPR